MTIQASELFEYEGKLYPIVGMQGGYFIPMQDLIIPLPTKTTSTGLDRWYQGVFAVDEQQRLILKAARYYDFLDGKLVNPELQLKQHVSMTGHILFGVGYHSAEWIVKQVFEPTQDKPILLLEAEISEGRVLGIRDCTEEILVRIKRLPSKEVPDDLSGTDGLRVYWDWTASFLPRHYDVLRRNVAYFEYGLFLKRE